MAVTQNFLAYVLEQLDRLPMLRSRRMFGGVGLYGEDLFFGLIDDDVLYLRVDEQSRADFVTRGSRPFQPFKDKPEFSMSYYDVPADVLEDAETLAHWARRALQVAAAAPRPAQRSKPPATRRPSSARKSGNRSTPRSSARERTR